MPWLSSSIAFTRITWLPGSDPSTCPTRAPRSLTPGKCAGIRFGADCCAGGGGADCGWGADRSDCGCAGGCCWVCDTDCWGCCAAGCCWATGGVSRCDRSGPPRSGSSLFYGKSAGPLGGFSVGVAGCLRRPYGRLDAEIARLRGAAHRVRRSGRLPLRIGRAGICPRLFGGRASKRGQCCECSYLHGLLHSAFGVQ
jgi:hypothetical protein